MILWYWMGQRMSANKLVKQVANITPVNPKFRVKAKKMERGIFTKASKIPT
jgi:hypothetical protein